MGNKPLKTTSWEVIWVIMFNFPKKVIGDILMELVEENSEFWKQKQSKAWKNFEENEAKKVVSSWNV